MRVILDSFSEIQDVKKLVNEKCDATMKVVVAEFKEQRVGILKQIDAYVKDVDRQLKGTKRTNEYGNESDWSFTNREYGEVNGRYPTYITIRFDSQNNNIKYNIALDKTYSGEKQYEFIIKNGHLDLSLNNNISCSYKEMLNDAIPQYEHELIKFWKDLKKNINDSIMSDFTKSQERINNRLNNAQIKKDLYDNFEV